MLKKAFDQVRLEDLLRKLGTLGSKLALYSILTSFLCGRTFRVRAGSTLSPYRRLTASIPQGFLLSPQLFALYMRDIPLPADPHTRVAYYAEDNAVHAFLKSPHYYGNACLIIWKHLPTGVGSVVNINGRRVMQSSSQDDASRIPHL
jgi:hypothetical protein